MFKKLVSVRHHGDVSTGAAQLGLWSGSGMLVSLFRTPFPIRVMISVGQYSAAARSCQSGIGLTHLRTILRGDLDRRVCQSRGVRKTEKESCRRLRRRATVHFETGLTAESRD